MTRAKRPELLAVVLLTVAGCAGEPGPAAEPPTPADTPIEQDDVEPRLRMDEDVVDASEDRDGLILAGGVGNPQGSYGSLRVTLVDVRETPEGDGLVGGIEVTDRDGTDREVVQANPGDEFSFAGHRLRVLGFAYRDDRAWEAGVEVWEPDEG